MNKSVIALFLLLGVKLTHAATCAGLPTTATLAMNKTIYDVAGMQDDALKITNQAADPVDLEGEHLNLECFTYELSRTAGTCTDLDNFKVSIISFTSDGDTATADKEFPISNKFSENSIMFTDFKTSTVGTKWAFKITAPSDGFDNNCQFDVKIAYKATAKVAVQTEEQGPYVQSLEPVVASAKADIVADLLIPAVASKNGNTLLEASKVRLVKHASSFADAAAAENLGSAMTCVEKTAVATENTVTVFSCTTKAADLNVGTYDIIAKFNEDASYRVAGTIVVVASNPGYYAYDTDKIVFTGVDLVAADGAKVVPADKDCTETSEIEADTLVEGTTTIDKRVAFTWTTPDPADSKVCYRSGADGAFFEVKKKAYFNTNLVTAIETYEYPAETNDNSTGNESNDSGSNTGAIIGGVVGGAAVAGGAGFGVYKYYL